MENLEQKKDIQWEQSPSDLVPSLNNQNNQGESQFLPKYKELMKLYQPSTNIVNWATEKFKKQNIIYSPQSEFVAQIRLRLMRQSINSEVIVARAQWGHFSFQINILNICKDSEAHAKEFQEGAYSHVYKHSFLKNSFAIKCTSFKDQTEKALTTRRAIREWFLLRIASALKCGPALDNYLGFDIFIFNNCVEFAMEICSPMSQKTDAANDLFAALALMHYFHIVHLDIKPANVMFSEQYQRYVFIDFGLSQLIDTEIGYKKKTRFSGNLSFCTAQMALIFFSTVPVDIDLYYNDAYGLQNIFYLIKQQTETFSNQELIYHSQSLKCVSFYIFLLKFYLFYNHNQNLSMLWSNQQIIEISDLIDKQLILFFEELEPMSETKQFFNDCGFANNNCVELKAICDVFANKSLIGYYQQRVNPDKRAHFSRLNDVLLSFDLALHQQMKKQLNVREVIFNSQKLKAFQREIYVNILLEFLSFSYNQHCTSVEEKSLAVRVYCEMYEPSLLIEHKSQFLKSSLDSVKIGYVSILEWCLQVSAQCSNKSLPKISKSIVLQNIFNILQHFFVLDIGDSQKFILRLQCIFNCPLLQNKDKIKLLFQIKSHKCWSIFRIRSKGELSRFQFDVLIIEWMLQKINMLKQSGLQESSKWIIDYAQDCLFTKQLSFYENIMQNHNHNTKNDQVVSIIKMDLFFRNQRNVIKYNTNLQDACKPLKIVKSRLYYFHLYWFHDYVNLRNQARYNEIYTLFVINLKSQEILSELSIEIIISLLDKTINIQILLEKCEIFLKQNKLRDFRLQHWIFYQIFQKLMFLSSQNNKEKSLSLKTKNKIEELIGYYCVLIQELKVCNYTLPLDEKIHICFQILMYFQLFFIEQCLHFIKNSKINLSYHFIHNIKNKYLKEKCVICLWRAKIFVLREQLLIDWHFLDECQDEELIEQLFLKCLNKKDQMMEMLKDCEDILWKDNFQLLAQSILFCICLKKQHFEKEYHGIEQFSDYCIKYNKMNALFQKYDKGSIYIQMILFVLFNNKSTDKLVNFLFELAKYASINQSGEIVTQLSRCIFRHLLLYNEQQSFVLYLNLKNHQPNHYATSYFAIYYYGLLVFQTNNLHYINQYLWSLAKSIANLPFQFEQFFQSSIYRYFIHVNNILNPFYKKRRLIFYNNKIVKLLSHQSLNLPQAQTHYKHRKNIYSKKLVSKIKNISKSFLIKGQNQHVERYQYYMK